MKENIKDLVIRLRTQGVSFGEITRQAKKLGYKNRMGKAYSKGSLHGYWHLANKKLDAAVEEFTKPTFELADTCGTTAEETFAPITTTTTAEETVRAILALKVPDSNKINALAVLFN